MDARAKRRHDSYMPLDLTDAELATAATACRAMAYQEGERAKKLENPTMRGPLESNELRGPGGEVRRRASTDRSVSLRPIPQGLRNDQKYSKPKPREENHDQEPAELGATPRSARKQHPEYRGEVDE